MSVDKVSILTVDDRPENLLVFDSIIDIEGVEIVKAKSGNEALAYVLDHDFAAIILDVQMPEMDGFETAELIRSIEKTKNIPIIFLTAISKDQEYIFKGYDTGAVDYLFKPIKEPKILNSKIKVFVELYKQRKLLELQTNLLEEKILELERINSFLSKLSYYDNLTGIPNRHSLEKYLEIMWKNSVRQKEDISVVMIDIDFFKFYNDNYGHIKGDEIIQKVARSIQASIKRPTDFVARYGGEEFIVILPKTEIEAAMMIAEGIRKGVEQMNLPHAFSNASKVITISLGCATINPAIHHNMIEFINTADKALYIAKQKGRNRAEALI